MIPMQKIILMKADETVPERENSLLTPFFIKMCIPLGLAHFLSLMIGSANSILAPVLIKEFSLSPANLGFMSSLFLITHASAQIPLGIFLDKFGAKKTHMPMLVLAGAGTILFGLAHSYWVLVIARIMIGVGFSGSMITAFKAYTEWVAKERLAFVFSLQCLVGGLGLMFATKPIAFALDIISWRMLYVGFGALAFLNVLLIWLFVPSCSTSTHCDGASFIKTLGATFKVITDKRFIYVAPLTTATQSLMLAYVFLWMGPWFSDIAKFSIETTGFWMCIVTAASAAGYLFSGVWADLFLRRGWMSWERFYYCSGVGFTICLLVITLLHNSYAAPFWAMLMLFATLEMIAFSITSKIFDSHEVGRALALLNFIIEAFSFAVQWFIGILLGLFPVINGHFSAVGYRTGLAIMLVLSIAAVLHLRANLIKRGL